MQVELDSVTVKRGGKIVFRDLTAVFSGPGLYQVIGPNGSGKTTLLLTIIGEVKSRIHGNDVKMFHEKTLKLLEELKETRTPLLVIFGLYTHPTAEVEAKRRGVLLLTPYNIVWNTNNREQCEIIQPSSN
jgi:ABC-type multidrug transport system ATPase subunit